MQEVNNLWDKVVHDIAKQGRGSLPAPRLANLLHRPPLTVPARLCPACTRAAREPALLPWCSPPFNREGNARSGFSRHLCSRRPLHPVLSNPKSLFACFASPPFLLSAAWAFLDANLVILTLSLLAAAEAQALHADELRNTGEHPPHPPQRSQDGSAEQLLPPADNGGSIKVRLTDSITKAWSQRLHGPLIMGKVKTLSSVTVGCTGALPSGTSSVASLTAFSVSPGGGPWGSPEPSSSREPPLHPPPRGGRHHCSPPPVACVSQGGIEGDPSGPGNFQGLSLPLWLRPQGRMVQVGWLADRTRNRVMHRAMQ